MSVAVCRDRRMQVAEFIEMIRPLPDEQRWELLEGQPILMAPQSERHQGIVANLLECLGPAARLRGCRALPGLGMLNEAFDDYAPIPDVVVRCGPISQDGYATDPIFIAEVLSPSTMDHDRGGKLRFYKAISSLRTLLIVYQDEARIEAWQRGDADEWSFRLLKGLEPRLDVPELGTTLAPREIYRDIPLADMA